MHHLIPQVLGGAAGPIVPLCGICHGLAHGIKRPMNLGALISAGIARSKAAGTWKGYFGRPKGSPATNPDYFRLHPDVAALGVKAHVAKVNAFAHALDKALRKAEAEGHTSIRSKVEWLNKNGFHTANGGSWKDYSLRATRTRVVARLAALGVEKRAGGVWGDTAVPLGRPKGCRNKSGVPSRVSPQALARAMLTIKEKAETFDKELAWKLEQAIDSGCHTNREQASWLNNNAHRTAAGREWDKLSLGMAKRKAVKRRRAATSSA